MISNSEFTGKVSVFVCFRIRFTISIANTVTPEKTPANGARPNRACRATLLVRRRTGYVETDGILCNGVVVNVVYKSVSGKLPRTYDKKWKKVRNYPTRENYTRARVDSCAGPCQNNDSRSVIRDRWHRLKKLSLLTITAYSHELIQNYFR